MTVLNFPVAARATEPVDLTRALMHLSDPGAQARIASSVAADVLREGHAEYWADGKAQAGASESTINFTAALHGLTEDRKAYWLRLTLHAVQVEMKHWADETYVLHTDEPHEILAELGHYYSSDDDQAEASRDNRERWAELADLAAHHAITEAQAATAFAQAA